LGKVLAFFENRHQVILSLVINGEKMDLPFIENFFPLIDLKEKRVEINLPEYI
jgi:ribosomal 30S subunit maturation factor RimM